MIIVSNTSPIISLSAIGQLDLLRQLYNKIIIPPAVYNEVANAAYTDASSVAVKTLPWIQVQQVTQESLIATFPKSLHRGEAEAIALAIELKANLLLIDEELGRKVSRRYGLTVIGVLGTLMAAKRRGLIPSVKPLIDDLMDRVGFRVSSDLYVLVLQQMGE